jgi:type I restriction enzyme S subunit
MTQLRGFPLLLPPIDLQYRFAERANEVARLRRQQVDAMDEADKLFASLQDRAFRGEL